MTLIPFTVPTERGDGIVAAPWPRNTYDLLCSGAKKSPSGEALTFFLSADDHQRPFTWTHAQALSCITQAANAFRQNGFGRHDVIAMVLPNLPEAHWTLWGAETSSIVMPINPLLEADMIANLLRAANVKAIVTLAPTPGTDIWQKVLQAATQTPSIQTLFTVSPLRYHRGFVGRALQAWAHTSTPQRAGKIKVKRLSREMAAAPSDHLTFDPPDWHDVASYFCTGGTTGFPKIARRSHGTEVSNVQMVAEHMGDMVGPDSSVLCALPLFHVNAQLTLGLFPLSQGSKIVLATPQGYRSPGVIQRCWEIIEHHKIAMLSGVPTVYAALLKSDKAGCDLSSLKVGICGAAPLPVPLRQRFESETGIRILEGYGMTEGGCVSTINPTDGSGKLGSVGKVLPGQRMVAAILDAQGLHVRDAEPDEIGVLLIHGPNLFLGYVNPDHEKGVWVERLECDGSTATWLNTGDMGRIDKGGHVFLTGRKKELIIRGGHNIDPRIIEDAMQRHPSVAMSAAVGRPCAYAGEVPVLYVQLHADSQADASELAAFAEREIAERAAIPKRVHIVPALPLTAVGKVFKPTLTIMEIKDVVEEEARRLGVALHKLDVTQDSKLGMVARYACDDDSALKPALGLYAFAAISDNPAKPGAPDFPQAA